MKQFGVILAMTGVLAVSCFGNSLWLLCVLFPPQSCEVVDVTQDEESTSAFRCCEKPAEPVVICVPIESDPVCIVQLTSTVSMEAPYECFWDPLELTAVLGKDHQPEQTLRMPSWDHWPQPKPSVRLYSPAIDRPPGIHPTISSTVLIL